MASKILNIDKYFDQGKVLQLATVQDDQPWICSVYYAADGGVLYWLSWPSRRHSREVMAHAKVAAAIAIATDQPVVGVQLEGRVEVVVDPREVERVMQKYVARHNEGKKFYDNFLAGTNQHVMYRLTPTYAVVFDELRSPGDARKELTSRDNGQLS